MDFEQFITNVTEWANSEEQIEGVVLVGSYARGDYKETSDIDFCVITTAKEQFISHPEIFARFGTIAKQKIEFWGACTSVRIFYEKGFEVEFGMVEPSWISLPLDAGTRRVLSDGYKILVDKCKCFDNLEL